MSEINIDVMGMLNARKQKRELEEEKDNFALKLANAGADKNTVEMVQSLKAKDSESFLSGVDKILSITDKIRKMSPEVKTQEIIDSKKAELNPEIVQIKKQEQQILKDAEPLSGDAATKYAGSTQALGNIKQIQDIFDLKKDESGKLTVSKDFSALKGKFSRELLVQKTRIGRPGSLVDVVASGFVGDIVKAFNIFGTKLSTKEGRLLATQFAYLAENNVRARSGATVPDPELVREEMRSFVSGLDDPETFLSKLKESDTFARTLATEIRPSRDYSKTGLTNFSESSDKDGIKFVDDLFGGKNG